MVLIKSKDQIRNEFKDLRKFKLPAKEIKELKLQWTNKMAEIKKEGLQLKEASSLAQEKKKLQDLEFLKTQSPVGPFTSAEEVEKYMKSEVDEEQRNKRLYTEMRYAKHSTVSMKRSSEVFRLKKNYKNLDSEDYAHNLKIYLGCLNSVNRITLEDFSYILTGLNAAHCGEISTSDSTTEPHKVNIGEHIVGVWADEHDTSGSMLTWHVGVVESIADGGATVSYLLQSNSRNKSHWIYPESAATFFTPYNQIIAYNLSVKYSCATIIRCSIDANTVSELNKLFEEYMNKF